MGASSLILALSALWTGPSWGQDRSGVGSILPGRVFSLRNHGVISGILPGDEVRGARTTAHQSPMSNQSRHTVGRTSLVHAS